MPAGNLNETIERIMTTVEQRRAAAPDCDSHPGNKRGECEPCRLADIAAINLDTETKHKLSLAKGCDTRFPRRYRCATADDPAVLAWVSAYLANPSGAQGLLIMGQTGTGKTHQAYGALRMIATHTTSYRSYPADPFIHWTETRWRATTHADLNASMRPGGDREPEDVLMRNQMIDMLLIDDLAAARTSEWVEEHTYRLINGRYEAMRPSIFTTNLSAPDLREAVGDRIASRLVESCVRVVLDGPDRRRSGGFKPEDCRVHEDRDECGRPSAAYVEPIRPSLVPFDPDEQ